MNNCHLWILKIYQVDIRNIHYPWYIDGIRKIYAKIYAIVYYVFCTVQDSYKILLLNTIGILQDARNWDQDLISNPVGSDRNLCKESNMVLEQFL